MKNKIILLFCLGVLLISFTSSQVSYDDCSIYGNCKPVSSITEGANYSINVNNTDYFQGYTPTTLKNWIQGLFESIFVGFDNIVETVGNWSEDKADYVPYTGANQNVDLGDNNLTLSNLQVSNTTMSNNISTNENGTMIIKTPNMEWRFY